MVTLPNLLSSVRLALVPLLLGLAWSDQPRAFLSCLIISLLTDIADGLLARGLHQTSEIGAKLDSWADLATYLCLPFCAWFLRPEVIRQEAIYIGAGIVFYLASAGFGFWKFRALTSYHTWGAKASAVVLGAAALVLFAGGPGWVFRCVIPIIVVAAVEEIAITAILTKPKTNVHSLWHALRIRREGVAPSN
jgi:CDP-diacylglycerol--glycerol-3-phosphate 3-phosphatidyltransferase